MKDKYLTFILNFSKISISSICKDLKIDRQNILNGKASEETTKKLYDELISRLDKLKF
jgi:hypothetical protein